jgi:hypothetical protein
MPGAHDPHPPVKRRVRGAGIARVPAQARPHPRPGVPPPRGDGRHAHPPARTLPERRSGHLRDRKPATDRGIGLLIIFTAGVLVMVGLIALTAIIDSWWMLGPVMAFDFVVTAAVLAIIVRLLSD